MNQPRFGATARLSCPAATGPANGVSCSRRATRAAVVRSLNSMSASAQTAIRRRGAASSERMSLPLGRHSSQLRRPSAAARHARRETGGRRRGCNGEARSITRWPASQPPLACRYSGTLLFSRNGIHGRSDRCSGGRVDRRRVDETGRGSCNSSQECEE